MFFSFDSKKIDKFLAIFNENFKNKRGIWEPKKSYDITRRKRKKNEKLL